MACVTRSVISANGGAFPCHRRWGLHRAKGNVRLFTVAAGGGGTEDSDCNADECAPEKEVGKISMEWLAGEKTKVVGTFPPLKKSWTGYVEKDTAGQTNIYSIEPSVYVAESSISSGTAGTSSDGADNIAAVVAGLALISIAAASSILIQVGKNSPPVTTTKYSGPPLSYYVNKFKPAAAPEAPPPPRWRQRAPRPGRRFPRLKKLLNPNTRCEQLLSLLRAPVEFCMPPTWARRV
ncbi:unnamed protein product [Spirodela intermedia]|uniref:Uncharacterized protein n=1 Tax=Spirodela intermedia TaxID=51605 RepID=A0A7I8IRI3_SPIIN|nr:unnamed protein product [Spirodela intermedia]CAA6660157.1 unnamed protein product [Spirodela intermedia]